MTSSSPSDAARYESGTDRLLVEVSGPVATVTFNNPGKHNALSADMRAALPGVLRALNADGDVRVIVMTGAGDKAFTAGADISEFGEQRTSPAATEMFDPCGEAISTGFVVGRACPESVQAWLGVSGGSGNTPRSAIDTTFRAVRSTVAIKFSMLCKPRSFVSANRNTDSSR